jgi:hypothetical protein
MAILNIPPKPRATTGPTGVKSEPSPDPPAPATNQPAGGRTTTGEMAAVSPVPPIVLAGLGITRPAPPSPGKFAIWSEFIIAANQLAAEVQFFPLTAHPLCLKFRETFWAWFDRVEVKFWEASHGDGDGSNGIEGAGNLIRTELAKLKSTLEEWERTGEFR